ncbi:MAG: hypothetical protein WDW38_007836 [Sanguina aurantia]
MQPPPHHPTLLRHLSQHPHGYTPPPPPPPPSMPSRAAGGGATPRGSTGGGGKRAAVVTLGEKSGPWPNPGGPLAHKKLTEQPPRRKDGLPQWLGYVVSRFWPNESGWFNGVVTDKKEGDSVQYCITYELGNPNESCEWLSLDLHDPSTCITSDKVNLLSTYPTTKAVLGSEVLRLFQAKSLSGSKNKRRASDEGADFFSQESGHSLAFYAGKSEAQRLADEELWNRQPSQPIHPQQVTVTGKFFHSRLSALKIFTNFTGRGHATDSREDLSLAMTLAQGVRGSHAHWYLPTAELIVYGEYWVNTIPIARGRKSYENITALLSLDSAVLAAHEFWEVFGPGGRLHPAYFLEHKGHLVVEGLLLFIIAFLFLQTSFKPKAVKAEAPLTDKEMDQLCSEWEPEPLVPALLDPSPEPVIVTGTNGIHATVNGLQVLNVASGNFYNLSGGAKLMDISRATIDKYGVGSCGPRGFYGTIDVHLHLEEHLAEFMGTPAAIIYSFDLATVASIIPAFANRLDILVVDECCAYPIQSGCTMSRAKVVTFKHNDCDDLERVLVRIEQQEKAARRPLTRRWIIVEGIYANYGDMAPLDRIHAIKEKYKYRLLVEESFSFWCRGADGSRRLCAGILTGPRLPVEKRGRGRVASAWTVSARCGKSRVGALFELPDVEVRVETTTGTPKLLPHPALVEVICASMGNALASVGGFCVGEKEVTEHQRLSGSGYCFSASLPPFLATAASAAIHHLRDQLANGAGPPLGADLPTRVGNLAPLFRNCRALPSDRALAGKGPPACVRACPFAHLPVTAGSGRHNASCCAACLRVVGAEDSSPLIHLQLSKPLATEVESRALLQRIADLALQAPNGVLLGVSAYSLLDSHRPPPSLRLFASTGWDDKAVAAVVAALRKGLKEAGL